MRARCSILLVILAAWSVGSAASQSQFVIEVAGGASNVGYYSSLALDLQGEPHVCFIDNPYGQPASLKYARKTGGVWLVEVADDGGGNSVGITPSLALDDQGEPHVTYYDETAHDLRYAHRTDGEWVVVVVDGFDGTYVGRYSSLALDAQGDPHVSYYASMYGELMYAHRVEGNWIREVVDNSPGQQTGLYTSLALDAEGAPHVSYHNQTGGDLLYAYKTGGTWTLETVHSGGADTRGLYTSLALDAQGDPHVSYYDDTADDLLYAHKTRGFWILETADGGAGNDVGSNTSLELDAQGDPHVTYSDMTAYDVKYARKIGGTWIVETVDDGSGNDVGWCTSLALDAGGVPHVTYYDVGAGDLRYGNASFLVESPRGGEAWPVGSLQQIEWTGVGPVTISLSVDGGLTYDLMAEAVNRSPYELRVPHAPTRFARVVIERAEPFAVARSDSFFTIDAVIALLRFEGRLADDGCGVALSWKTDPGPEADIRYRLERAPSAGAFAPVHPGLLEEEAYVDLNPGTEREYRLFAVNGSGEEYLVGETSIAPALLGDRDLAILPNPTPSGAEILFRVPFDARRGAADVSTELRLFDVSGRLRRSLMSGMHQTGTGAISWDGRDHHGRRLGPGIYVIRLRSGGVEATQRLTVVR